MVFALQEEGRKLYEVLRYKEKVENCTGLSEICLVPYRPPKVFPSQFLVLYLFGMVLYCVALRLLGGTDC